MNIINLMFNIIGIILIVFLIILLYTQFYPSNLKKVFENLTNMDNIINENNLKSTGIGASSTTYNSNLNFEIEKLKDELIIRKYRKDYENIVVQYDDLLNLLMLKNILSLNISSSDINNDEIIEKLQNLNTLKTSKDGLAQILKFLDTN